MTCIMLGYLFGYSCITPIEKSVVLVVLTLSNTLGFLYTFHIKPHSSWYV